MHERAYHTHQDMIAIAATLPPLAATTTSTTRRLALKTMLRAPLSVLGRTSSVRSTTLTMTTPRYA